MAKKRDRHGRDGSGMNRAYQSGVDDPRAFKTPGTSFADSQEASPSEGDIEAWEDDQKTAPDLFADASDEGQVQASGGHTQQLDEEPGKDRPNVRRR
jgi:hypothetical protein